MADWISATTLMLRSSFSARRRFLRTGIEQRQPAFHVGVDVGLAVLDLGGVDQPAVDVVAQHGLDVGRRRSGCRSWRPGRPTRSGGVRDLGRLDEPHPGDAVGGREQPQEDLAVAVAPADDLLLPLVPAVDADEVVEERLDVGHESRRRRRWPRRATAR